MKVRWIPTSEQLPEDEQGVLLVHWRRYLRIPEREVSFGYHDGKGNFHLGYEGCVTAWSEDVTHWMPLPPLPEEGK